jgi:type IV pilus assembly protein PilQ
VRSKTIQLISFMLILAINVHSQNNDDDRFKLLAARLEDYASQNPKIDKQIDISITGTLQEFAMAFSKETKINLTIDPTLNQRVVTNFSETKPRDILLYLCRFYNLELAFSGSIISLIPFNAPPKKLQAKEIQIKFNTYNNTLELNLQNDTLDQVVKKISELTKLNVITSKEASNDMVSGFVGAAEFDEALEQFAKRNELTVTKDKNKYYVIERKPRDGTGNKNNNQQTNNSEANAAKLAKVNDLTVSSKMDSLNDRYFKVDARNVSIADIIKQVSQEAREKYFLYAEPTEKTSFTIEDATYEEILRRLLNGTKYTYKKDAGVYLIGDRKLEGIRGAKVLQMKHRTVKDFTKLIPKDFSENIQMQEFIELNSLIISGSPLSIDEFTAFVEQIDKPVPVINIELFIVNVTANTDVKTGLEIGTSDKEVTPGGSVFPGFDFTFSSKGINELVRLINGSGVINIGQVKSNFYATLQAVETNGYAKVHSKPRLSTLNGKEANFSIGETRYFKVERTTLQGNQTPISLQDRTYQSVNADFSVKITPVVSGDEFVTLDIDVKQSDFTGQVAPDAPPAQVSRNFSSNIRIKNREMIVLGGLESKTTSESGKGVPLLSRIPIIKWFFSKRQKSNQKSELLIFVKPTVYY